MGFFFLLILVIPPWATMAETQQLKSPHLLDLYIRDYTLKSFDNTIRTGTLHRVPLPKNFSGVDVVTARFRCGSLRRYGAQVKEFHLGIGVSVSPCAERIILVRQNLGSDWSSVYFSSYGLSGYQLVSSILGLSAFSVNFTSPFISAGETPIAIDFSDCLNTSNVSEMAPYCASFESNGKVTLAKQVSSYTCAATRNGHFGLVVEEGPPAPAPDQVRKKERPWKVAAGSSIGAAIGAFLLGLLVVAMFARVKKRTRMDEMERRAYEEEALQVSMVGHVRAPVAVGTRTAPTIENEYLPPRR